MRFSSFLPMLLLLASPLAAQQNCHIYDLTASVVQTSPNNCQFYVVLQFQHNGTTNQYTVQGNGQNYGTFTYGTNPNTLGPFTANPSAPTTLEFLVRDAVLPDCKDDVFVTVPPCGSNTDCAISNLQFEVGDCVPGALGYSLTLDFDVQNPGNDLFEVWGNNTYLGIFPIGQLPLQIPNFPSNGPAVDVLKVCINDQPDCCKIVEFQGPNCPATPCGIHNFEVETGECTSDSTFEVWVDFDLLSPSISGAFALWANGENLGVFNVTQLPLHIEDFPWNGLIFNQIKICVGNDPVTTCCREFQFLAPGCLPFEPCEITNLTVGTGPCAGDSSYQVTVNFNATQPGNGHFVLWGNGQLIDTFALTALPLTIPDFHWNGGNNDMVRVCLLPPPSVPPVAFECCKIKEFAVPECLGNEDCEIYNMVVDPGDCTSNTTYSLFLNFQVNNPSSNIFVLYVNGTPFGTFNLNQLPLNLSNILWGGGNVDVLKICFANNTGTVGGCCKTIEVEVPECLGNEDCEIYDLVVDPGDCTSNTTYSLTLDFEVQNPPASVFQVIRGNQVIGIFNLSQLPLTIPNFPWGGGNNDVVKVCFLTNAASNICCAQVEFEVPECLGGQDCEIYNVVVDPGDCTSNTTYSLFLNFQVDNPPGNFFAIWVNNVPFGTFNLNQLPLNLSNIPWGGGNVDVLKICFANAPGMIGTCCKTIEVEVPECLGNEECEIYGLVVDPGDCTSDSTYSIFINFQVNNPPSNLFVINALNGQTVGTFNLNQLPLQIPNFPWSGESIDGLKVCFLSTSSMGICCSGKQFEAPDCLNNEDCHIYDLHVVRTPCLCGQFFAVLNFSHQGGGAGGFDIVGNGNNYGNFAYNHPQPIILGPFEGNGTTPYEFVVRDHNHPDCQDNFDLGPVQCSTPLSEPGSTARLALAPNPVANWLGVTASMDNGTAIGQANVEIYYADGRLVRSKVVAQADNFQLEVADLPAGMYRLVLLTEAGRLEGSFAKQ
jgi:hypothetical protein